MEHATLKEEIKAEIAKTLGFSAENLPTEINSADAAKILHIKPNTLSVWRSTGRNPIPFFRVGKAPYYRIDDLIEFMLSKRFLHSDSGNTT